MKSLKRFSLPLLGGLVAFLMVAGISSAATVTLADLVTAKTYFVNEIQFDHDMNNPLQVTITGATWAAGSIGDVRLNESDGGSLSDVVRFVNVGGVANIYFGSSDFRDVVPLTGPLSGPSPGFTRTRNETVPGLREVFNTTQGVPISATITSDIIAGGSISDHITLQAPIPEPSTFTLAGLGALGLIIRSVRRRRA